MVDTQVRPPVQRQRRPVPTLPMPRPAAGYLALAIAGSWAVTAVAYLAHAAIVLPALVLVATASLLRGGRTLLDRLMLAAGLLLGATAAAGVLFAVWPWGLHPIPVAGFAFTVLIVVARLTGRRPNLPRPALADLLSTGAAAAMAALVAWPLVTGGPTHRLSVLIAGEDLARHATIFDAIRHVGGYLFVDWHTATGYAHSGMIAYPQGSHLTAALLDGFVRSSASQYGTGLDALDHYLVFVVVGYAFLTLAMIWAAQRLAGASLTVGRRIALIAFVTAACATTELISLVVMGYPSEVMGLAETILLVALLARPTPRTGQQLLLMSSLLVAIGFTYYLFLPAAGLAVLVWLVRNRVRLGRHRLAVALTAAGSLAAGVPILLGLTVGKQATALLQNGHLHPSRDLLLAVGCAVLAGLLGRRALRSRIWRSYAWCLTAVGVLAGALLVGQPLAGVSNGYYASKTLHLALAVLVVGAGSLALYLPRPEAGPVPVLRVVRGAVPGALVAVAIVAFSAAPIGDSPFHPVKNTNWARLWAGGGYRNDTVAEAVLREYRSRLGQPVAATIMLTDAGFSTYTETLFLSTLQRTVVAVAPGLYQGLAFDSPDLLDRIVVKITGPIRIVAQTDTALARARQIKDRHPDLPIEVVRPLA